jgi:GT2 family glycosyltransferase
MNIAGEHQPDKIQNFDTQILLKRNNFGSCGRSRMLNEIFSDTLPGPIVWQPDVYHEAALLAKRLNFSYVIDIGCGNGDKLNDVQIDFGLQGIGLDFQSSIEAAVARYPDSKWIDANLQDVNVASGLLNRLSPFLPAVIILSDVIEHLPDVRPCLKLIRDLIAADENSFVIISTPDRERQNREEILSVPPNKAHIREWSLKELTDLILNFGFEISRCGWTRANQFDEYYTTSFVQAGYNQKRHLRRLSSTFKAPPDWSPKHILITSEMHGWTPSGGIGSFVTEQQTNYGESECAVLVVSQGIIPNNQRPVFALLPEDICGTSAPDKLPIEDFALLAVETLYYLAPSIETVQFQEYQGVGFRVAQAKRAGLLPSDLIVAVHCHGATHYLENGRRDWLGQSHMISSIKEKICIENADVVYFPSAFLRDLYDQSGLNINRHHSEIRRYPYHAKFFSKYTVHRVQNIDTLIFFGKRTLMKGYGLFLDALSSKSLDRLFESGLRRVVIIGPHTAESDQWIDAFDALRKRFEVVVYNDLVRDEAISCMAAEAGRSLAVLPYLADNYPFAVFDAMAAGCLPILVDAGGVPEMLPPEFVARLVAKAEPVSLCEKILSFLSMSGYEVSELKTELAKSINERQQKINNEAKAPIMIPARAVKERLTSAVIIPFYNTPIEQLENLLWSLNLQLRRPDDVVVLDDASSQEMAAALDGSVAKWGKLGLPIRCVRHDVNKGLAGARNTALAAVETDVTVNIDSDDVVLPNFLADILNGFEYNSDVAAVVPYLEAFDDKADYQNGELNGYAYRPLGDGMIASQTDNLLGHANSGFRTSILKQLGGWDTTGRAMWEDYALFLRLISLGNRIAVVPRTGVLYRVTPKSMARSYARWPAMRLIARALDGLPRFEAFRLQAALRGLQALETEAGALRNRLDEAERLKVTWFLPKIEEQAGEILRLSSAYEDTTSRLNLMWNSKLDYFEPTIEFQQKRIVDLEAECEQLRQEAMRSNGDAGVGEQNRLADQVVNLNQLLEQTTSRLDEVWAVKVNYFEPLVKSQAEEIAFLRKALGDKFSEPDVRAASTMPVTDQAAAKDPRSDGG